ncbi:unnamed protein product [Malus baccata var. baccata]
MSPPPQQTLRPPAAAGPFLFPQTQSTVLPDPSNFFSPNLLSSPLPTNSFFQNFALKNGDQPEYFHPYAVKSSSAALTICYPSRFSTSAFIYQVFIADLAISATQKPDSPQPHKISSFNDLSITLDFPSSNLRFFLVRGSPFITCSVSNSTSLSISTIHAILSCESNGSKTKYTIKLNSNQTWLVYTSSPIDLTTSGLSLITSNGFSGIVRIAILPDSNPKFEASLDRFSSCYPVSGEAVFTKPFVLEYRWEKKGWGDLLMLAHPLHLQLLSGDDSHVTVLEDFKFKSIDGDLVGVVGDSWALKPDPVSITWHSSQGVREHSYEEIVSALVKDVGDLNSSGIATTSSYFYGKLIARAARLALIAEELLPLLPITEALFSDVGFVKDLVKWTLPALSREGVGEGWKGFVYSLEGIYDKELALGKIRNLNGYDDGNSLTNLLWWIHSRGEAGAEFGLGHNVCWSRHYH